MLCWTIYSFGIIGADGIRLQTLSQYYELLNTIQKQEEKAPELSYLKIFLILGLSSYKHSFLTKGGFYTLDGTCRLFTMPFDDERTMVRFCVIVLMNISNVICVVAVII